MSDFTGLELPSSQESLGLSDIGDSDYEKMARELKDGFSSDGYDDGLITWC